MYVGPVLLYCPCAHNACSTFIVSTQDNSERMEKEKRILKNIEDLQRQLQSLKIEEKCIQTNLTNSLACLDAIREEKKELVVGQKVLYCAEAGGKKFNRKGVISRVTEKCVWIKYEDCLRLVRRSKKNVKLI
jgi:hypothetical protein